MTSPPADDLNAAFGFHSRAGVHDFHGTGMTTPFLLQSSAGDKPFPGERGEVPHWRGRHTLRLVVKKKKSSVPGAANAAGAAQRRL